MKEIILVFTVILLFSCEQTQKGALEGSLGKEVSAVDIEEFVQAKEDLSGADIKAICSEAGLLALRERRMKVTQDDFKKAKERALYKKKGSVPEGLYL